MSSTEFRNALGAFTTGVCLITVNDAHSGALALTANSFSSLSLEPPLVLWNIQNDSDCFREYTECTHFGISILCADQQALSSAYARKDNHTIVEDDFITDEHGVPLLKRAVARFSCKNFQLVEAGDHHIVIGEVTAFDAHDESPLLFSRGSYDQLASRSD
jgi:flavin reductase (DIM6/NTAB) family NADH-FMN oxidoreductase RutF